MDEILSKILTITIVIFMAGSLFELGLKLRLNEASGALRNTRFVVLSLLWSFGVGPGFALLVTKAVPMDPAYGLGLMFLGMAPCAPFLPIVAARAGGSLAYVAAYIAMTAVGTLIFMPFAVPVLIPGFSADAWTIAKPLLLFIAMPLFAGAAIRRFAAAFAEKYHPMVKKWTTIDIVIMLALILWLYGGDDVRAIGSYAIAGQLLYYTVLAGAAYGLGFGLPHGQRSVLALGLATRNVGAALAPLMAVAGTDRRAIAMCFLAVIITVITGFSGAAILARLRSAGEIAGADSSRAVGAPRG